MYHWDYFITVTFKSPRKEPYYALKTVWNTLHKDHFAQRGFLVAEPHQSGDLHIHGLIAGNRPGWKPELHLPWDIKANMDKKYGWTQCEALKSHKAVSNYCAKYLLKQQRRVCDYYAVFGDKEEWLGGRLN